MSMSEIWPVHKSPRLELELVSAKRLSDRLWRPTWRMSDRTCIVHWSDVSPHFFISVHVARLAVETRCHLRFPLYVKPFDSHAPFTVSLLLLSIFQTFLPLKHFVFFPNHFKSLKHNHSKVCFFIPSSSLFYHSNALHILWLFWDCLFFRILRSLFFGFLLICFFLWCSHISSSELCVFFSSSSLF